MDNSRYVGNAVLRNKLKRWCREYFSKLLVQKRINYDLNVVLRKRDKDFIEISVTKEFCNGLERAAKRFFKVRCLSSIRCAFACFSFYRIFLSSWIEVAVGFTLLFTVFSLEAFQKHSAHIAFYLTLRRLLRCRPEAALE